jgi:RNA polymerase sigma factor (TIGR02999 family)
MSAVTHLLDAAAAGDPKAAAELFPLVYDELRRLAVAQMAGEHAGHTLQATALVHEAYIRLAGPADSRRYADRGHFFAAAATAMRRILIESARRKQTLKRGGAASREPLGDVAAPEPTDDLVALSEALDKFATVDPEKAKLVELRYFAGLSGEQAAAVLGISPATADRHWQYAKAWLQTEMSGG